MEGLASRGLEVDALNVVMSADINGAKLEVFSKAHTASAKCGNDTSMRKDRYRHSLSEK